jgi:hypothetical protein
MWLMGLLVALNYAYQPLLILLIQSEKGVAGQTLRVKL